MPEGNASADETAGEVTSPRTGRTINSGWTFHKGDPPASASPPFEDADWAPVGLPHCWNTEDVLSDEPGYYRGPGWYQRALRTPADAEGRLYLFFDGANQDTVLYVNGARVGEHLGGYTAFVFDITDQVEPGAENILSVRVSNAPNEDVPPIAGDLMHFGGIYRSVHLLRTGPVHFEVEDAAAPGVLIDTPRVSAEEGTVRPRGRLLNHGPAARDVEVVSTVRDPEGRTVAVLRTELSLEPDARQEFVQGPHAVAEPLLWSPAHPHLYTVTCSVVDRATDEVLDSVTNPLGFRWFSVDADAGLFLNGERCFIKGVGKHQDHPGVGYAAPDEVHRADARKAKEMGANMLRSHFPQPRATYEACDRLGLMAWAKIPIMQKITHTEEFARNTRRMVREMILQNYNHPSVVMWGYMCEILGDLDWYWPEPRDLREGPLPDGKLCVNVGQSRTYFRDPLTGNHWLPDRPHRPGGFGHVDGDYYTTWTEQPAWQGVRQGVHHNIRGTELDPVYQTFLVGLTDYRLDLPAGRYDVTLYFTEPFPIQRRRSEEEKTGADTGGRRVFDVVVNGRCLVGGLDLAGRCGDRRPVTVGTRLETVRGEGVRVNLVARRGKPVLSGVKVLEVS